MKGQIATGWLVGDGAAQTVRLGWIPDYVKVVNVTDGDKITEGWLGYDVPFSSGGTTEIVAGAIITGATTGAKAFVRQVLTYSGTWAGGDAAGFFIVEMIGTVAFGSENVYVSSDTTAGTNDATVTVNVEHTVSIDTESATETGDAAIIRAAGTSGSAAAGFTIGLTISEEAKLLRYLAVRGDQ
jgi:hypothetical protein